MTQLETQNLLLRPFETSDVDDVQAYASDPEVVRFMWWGPNDEAASRNFVEFARRTTLDPESRSFQFAIVPKGSTRVVGAFGLTPARVQFREFEIGYVLHRDVWRRGFGYEAASRVLRFAFTSLEAHRVYASIDPENGPSLALIAKLGFRREGLFRADSLIRGEWRDSAIYALLENESRASAFGAGSLSESMSESLSGSVSDSAAE